LVDELNRAMQGEAASGYVSPLHVVTTANVRFDGGDKNIFDPGNGYREAYAAIWGKQLSAHCDGQPAVKRPRRLFFA
jgi:ribose transport system substrate-binding protein